MKFGILLAFQNLQEVTLIFKMAAPSACIEFWFSNCYNFLIIRYLSGLRQITWLNKSLSDSFAFNVANPFQIRLGFFLGPHLN